MPCDEKEPQENSQNSPIDDDWDDPQDIPVPKGMVMHLFVICALVAVGGMLFAWLMFMRMGWI